MSHDEHVRAVGFAGSAVAMCQARLDQMEEQSEAMAGMVRAAIGWDPTNEHARAAAGQVRIIQDDLIPKMYEAYDKLITELNAYGAQWMRGGGISG